MFLYNKNPIDREKRISATQVETLFHEAEIMKAFCFVSIFSDIIGG